MAKAERVFWAIALCLTSGAWMLMWAAQVRNADRWRHESYGCQAEMAMHANAYEKELRDLRRMKASSDWFWNGGGDYNPTEIKTYPIQRGVE